MGRSKVDAMATASQEQAIEACAESGFQTSARTLRHLRDAGLIPAAARHGLGRGGGSAASYSPEQLQQVVAAAQRQSVGHSFSLTGLWLLRDGWPVDDQIIIDTYNDYHREITAQMDDFGDRTDPEQRYGAFAATLWNDSHPTDFTRDLKSSAKRISKTVDPDSLVAEISDGERPTGRAVFMLGIENLAALALDGIPLSDEGVDIGYELDADTIGFDAAPILDAVAADYGEALSALFALVGGFDAWNDVDPEKLRHVVALINGTQQARRPIDPAPDLDAVRTEIQLLPALVEFLAITRETGGFEPVTDMIHQLRSGSDRQPKPDDES